MKSVLYYIFGSVNCISVVLFTTFTPVPGNEHLPNGHLTDEHTEHPKLLILMLDGFRWDYYERQKEELVGFPKFLEDGTQVEWVEPIFPSVSYPSWTSISTGVYPKYHGILGNYMFDLKLKEYFYLNNDTSTSKVHWWVDAEPLWITATRSGKKCYLRFWSRCDVPHDEILPATCSPYRTERGVDVIQQSLNLAIDHLLLDYDLAMVYGEHLDNVGHEFGPDSEELMQAMRDIDQVIYEFINRLLSTKLGKKVNVVIVSDHGMKWIGDGSGTIFIPIGDFVDKSDVISVLDFGATMSIAVYKSQKEHVYNTLKNNEGFETYTRDDIPEEYHYGGHRLVQDILLVAKPKYFLKGISGSKQIPEVTSSTKLKGGAHGYYNVSDMRTIFFARGPDIKRGHRHPPIDLIDEYQIFAKLLRIEPCQHNGTWENVADMFTNDGSPMHFHPTIILNSSLQIILGLYLYVLL